MSIDTQDKRTASIGVGSAYRAGTRRPTATTSAFLRGSCLGLYYLEAITDPGAEGWITRVAVRQFVSPVASRLSMTSPQDRVWIARVDNG